MLSLAFLNPMLLWALPLAAVPIVIHILNRRRFRRVKWAAMEYLLRAMQRNRQRLRMEQWLVLLLRTLAVLLLALLVSRPQLGGGGLLGARTHHVVVLDDSASMQQQSGTGSLYQRASERLRGLAEDFAVRRAGDSFSVVRASRAEQPDLWRERIGPDFGRRLAARLPEWSVGDRSIDLGAALRAVVTRARADAEGQRTEYYLLGDQRSHDWLGADDKPRPVLAAVLAGLDASTEHLTAIGVGGSPANVGIVAVRLVDRLLVAGVPARFVAEVRNHGLDPSADLGLSVEIDGRSRIALEVPALAPGEQVPVPFVHTFHEPGEHRVVCELDAADTYVVDDQRTLALEVRPRSRVLLVDGEPDVGNGETFFLQVAFEPGGEATSGIEAQVVGDANLAALELGEFDAVWLCNVQALDAPVVARLEAFVAAGGGLVVACGPLVDVARYDELLWRGGQGLLPLPIGEIDGDPDRPERAVLTMRDHGVADGVGDVLDLLVAKVWLVRRWLTLGEPAEHRASVVARIRAADGPPLLATRTYVGADGRAGGEVALLAVTADDFWSNLPATHLQLVLANQLQRFVARRADFGGRNFDSDGTLQQSLDPGVHRADATVRSVDGAADERTFTAKPGPAVDDGPASLDLRVPMAELRHRGAYQLELVRHDGGTDVRWLARNAPADESRLAALPAAAFARIFPPEVQERVTFVADGASESRDDGQGELWRWLAAALVAGLLLESLLAWRFGRH
jgi:hypothetical protein